MTRNQTTYCLVAALTVCLLAGGALADLLAYEGFNYGGETQLTGKDGGSGFNGAWTSATSFNEITGTGQSLTMSNLHFTPKGDHLLGTNYQHDIWSTAERPLASTATVDFDQEGQFFVSMLIQRPTETHAKAALRGLNSQGDQLWRFEIASGYNVPFVGIGSGPYDYADDGSFRMAVGVTYFMVAKIETHEIASDTISLKLYLSDDTIDIEEPDTWNANVSTEVSGVFSTLRVDLGRDYVTALDEIRIGTTWESVVVPEPAAMSLLALGGAVIVKRRKK